MRDGEKIEIFNKFALIAGIPKIYGKEIIAKIIVKNLGKLDNLIARVGTLSPIKRFIESIECQNGKKVIKFLIEKKEIKIDGEDRSFISLGLNHNFECEMIFEEDKNN